MSAKSNYQQCLDWIYNEKATIEAARYGRNLKSVNDAILEQERKAKGITDYKRRLDTVLAQTASDDEKKHLQDAYDKLVEVSKKKINCLQTMLQITMMEDSCGALSREFDAKAVHLVNPEERKKILDPQAKDHIQGFVAPSTQDCIFAAEDNWTWQVRLVQCIEIHLKNAADYHKFFHEIDESEHFMLDDLNRLKTSFELDPIQGDYNDAQRLLKELDEMITALKQWETKTNFMWDRALKIVPVHLRVEGVTEATPIRSLCNYDTKDVSIREGEELLLLDNSQPKIWKVRNARGQEVYVPALLCLIPGPYKDALDAAVRMRLQLLAAWTAALRRIGMRLICFMLLVFKPVYNVEEINILTNIRTMDKQELLRMLDVIENTLREHWGDHEGFVHLQERILALRMILEEAGEHPLEDENVYRALVVQITMLEQLMNKYKDLWRDWEKYKVSLEASRSPELMLIVDKWQQLQYVTKEYFTKFWNTDLGLSKDDKLLATLRGLTTGDIGEGQLTVSREVQQATEQTGAGMDTYDISEIVTKATVSEVSSKPRADVSQQVVHHGMSETGEHVVTTGEILETTKIIGYEEMAQQAAHGTEETDFGVATETKLAETEQLSHAEMEERKTFVIRSVVDPRTKTEVSLNDAIAMGIINPGEGNYVNPQTKEVIPIPVAMTQGLIKVEFTSTRRSAEKKSAIGIITVKTIREKPRPYRVISVKDLKTGEVVGHQDAMRRGIVQAEHGTYKDTRSGRIMLMSEAIQNGLMKVEYESEAPETEEISQTYAVRGVVDTAQKTVITFLEAVRRGIINKETGEFRDTQTGDSMYVGDAIMRGFLKARQITDTKSLDIDPQNKMVVDKTELIRKRLLRPLGVISALRRAAKADENK